MTKKEFYNSLSDELKAKIRTCKSEDEMLKTLEDAGVELDPELLEGVSGGTVSPCPEHDKTFNPCFCD